MRKTNRFPRSNQHRWFIAACTSAALVFSACGAQQSTADTTAPHTLDAEAELALRNADLYVCDSGTELRAAYPDTNTAVLQYQGSAHILTIAVSADGARYIDSDLEWWTKGSGDNGYARLSTFRDDGHAETLETNCRVQ